MMLCDGVPEGTFPGGVRRSPPPGKIAVTLRSGSFFHALSDVPAGCLPNTMQVGVLPGNIIPRI